MCFVAQLVVYLLACAVGVALLLVAATVFYDLALPRAAAAAALVYAAGALAMCALGFIVAALAPNARTANAIGFVVYFPMIFLCGAVIPRHALSRLDAAHRRDPAPRAGGDRPG